MHQLTLLQVTCVCDTGFERHPLTCSFELCMNVAHLKHDLGVYTSTSYIHEIFTRVQIHPSKFWLYKPLWPSIHRIQTIVCTKKLLCSINTTKYMSVIEIRVIAFAIYIRSNSCSYKFNCSVVFTICNGKCKC